MSPRPKKCLTWFAISSSSTSAAGRPDSCAHPPPHRRPGFRSLGHLSQRRRPRGRLDPDLHPEAPLRALARGPGPSRTAPRPRARPRAPLGAGEGCRQAPLALVPGDRPPEDFQDHGRHRHQRPPALPKESPARLRHRGRRRRRAGVPLPTVATALGHSNLQTTAVYTTVAGLEARDFLARMWERKGNSGQLGI